MGKFVVMIVAVLLVVGTWSGGWLYGAGEIRRVVSDLGAGDGETEPKVTCRDFNVSGFPFRFDLECLDATIVSGDTTAGLAGLRASVLAYNPTQVKFSALAPLTLSDAFSGARNRVAFKAAEGSARFVTDDLWQGLSGEGWRIGRISVVADEVAWIDTIVGETEIVRSTHVEGHLLDMPEQHDAAAGTSALRVHATLSDVAAPAMQIAGGEAALEAELTGLPDDLRAFSAPDIVQRWQAAGGQLKLVELAGTAGEEFIESSGALALDSGARLDGQVALRHRGLVERFGNLIPAEWQGLVLGGQGTDGSYAQTINIKAGVVFSGLLPVTMIPPLF